jgi:gas vesicle protein
MISFVAVAAGAAAMYFFDPQSGRRRRALVRDKFAWLRDEVGDVREAAEGRAEDLRNRATGVLHETRSAIGDVTGAGIDRSDGTPQTPQTKQRVA